MARGMTGQRIAGLAGMRLPDMNDGDLWSLMNSDVKVPISLAITVSGHVEAAKYFRALPGVLRSTAGRGARNAAQQVVKNARQRVPYDTGDTHNSIRVQSSKENKMFSIHDVVADTAYAWYIHETNLEFLQRDRAPQQPPTPYIRQWKFLEAAGEHVMKSYDDIIGQEIIALIEAAKAQAALAGVPQRGGPPRLIKGGSKPSSPALVRFSAPLTDQKVRGFSKSEISNMFSDLGSLTGDDD